MSTTDQRAEHMRTPAERIERMKSALKQREERCCLSELTQCRTLLALIDAHAREIDRVEGSRLWEWQDKTLIIDCVLGRLLDALEAQVDALVGGEE